MVLSPPRVIRAASRPFSSQLLHPTAPLRRFTMSAAAAADSKPAKKPWHSVLPVPRADVPEISPEELHQIVQSKAAGRDYVIVDVRTNADLVDDGAFVLPGSINLPAQTFFQTLPRVYTLLQNIPIVVFNCNSCKPNGRGPRSAAWYQDHADDHGWKGSKAYILAGGLKAWKDKYPNDLIPVVV